MAMLNDIIDKLNQRFRTRNNSDYNEETGITYDAGKDIKKIGYCTNLTPEVVNKANELNVDLILTHHDAWHFIYGLKEECMELLKKYGISHYFNHSPLDDCEFGTNNSLAKELGLTKLKKVSTQDGYSYGVIGEFDKAISHGELRARFQDTLKENSLSWKFHNKKIKRAFILCGAGHLTSDMKEAVEENCDVYITGEKILYTVQYAKIHNINVLVGSHTFTELPGVKSMAEIVVENNRELDMVLIKEDHLETAGML
ncbi:Nif3-like dinuclear metal center hexameric protein [Dethiothermospora halolimnae]|uniref:Nif3-like dinuclear metal center hexameric protein n=1 Tax=Dethiothermospora halolimnae TaxID=3114390 RepID=UPI003CCC41C7